MYNVGDRVVYPMYGAGIVEGIEDKEIDGVVKSYYVLKIPIGDLKIMVSVEKAEKVGLRNIIPAEEVIHIVNEAEPISMSSNWSERNKQNVERLKTGDLLTIMRVFKTLVLKEKKKSLSSIEKKLLGTAKQIILSEIILSQNIDKQGAEHLLMNGVAIPIS